MASYKQESRREWSTDNNPKFEELRLGCFQRIADATEHMSKNYVQLQADHDMFKRWYREQMARADKLDRRVAALRGVITKMKKKDSEQEGQTHE